MRSLLFALVLSLLFPFGVQAQRWHVNVNGGVSNYSGDLQAKYFTLDQSNATFGVGLQYDLSAHFALTSNLQYLQIAGADRFNKPNLQFRNLSFESKMVELNLMAEYTLLDLNYNRISPFINVGIAGFHFNPYAFDSLGNKVFLKPLSTEGEGLAAYPARKPYNLLQLSIPFGGGIKFRVSDNIVLAYEIGYRKTFTDYLDDVSTSYVDRATLLVAKGPKAVELAYRAGELKGGDRTYPVDGTKRGGADAKDYYYTQTIRVSVTLFARKDPNYGRGRIDCPTNVQ